jgi:hypothetical protein
MNRGSWQRLGIALGATVMIGVSVPAIAGAQQPSGAASSRGVSPAQLPRTGNPDADSNGILPFILLSGGVVAASLVVRGRKQREHDRRRQQ